MAAINILQPTFYDGFDHSATGLSGKWTSGGSSSNTSATTPFGFGRSISPGSAFTLYKTLSANYPAMIAMGYFKTGTNFIDSSSTFTILGFCDGSAEINNCQLGLSHDGAGRWRLRRGATLIDLATTPASFSTWYHVCMACTFHGSNGTAHLWVNGELVCSNTSIDTTQTANTYAQIVSPGTGGQTGALWDDFIVWAGDSYTVTTQTEGTFGSNGDYPGPLRVVTSWPDGNGTTNQMTPNTGTNYTAVNETQHNSDTSYVSESTAGQYDLYTVEAFPFTPSLVYSAQVVTVARMDSAAASQIKNYLRDDGGTNRLGSAQSISASYAAYTEQWHLNPNGSTAWTETSLNAVEIGQECEALA